MKKLIIEIVILIIVVSASLYYLNYAVTKAYEKGFGFGHFIGVNKGANMALDTYCRSA